jgi:hypothetical protein
LKVWEFQRLWLLEVVKKGILCHRSNPSRHSDSDKCLWTATALPAPCSHVRLSACLQLW